VKAQAVKTTKSTTQKKDESSDEEVDDELDLETQAMSYGNIKEKKDVASNEKQEEAETQGYGFENSSSVPSSSAPQKKKDASEITFGGGRPKFGRKAKGQFGNEFSEGLDDIDDDGNIKNKPKKELSKAEGNQRDFVNLGSKARVGGKQEDEKVESKPTGVKPTFKGKLNLTKGDQEGDFGPVKTYDYSAFKPASNASNAGGAGGEQKERKQRDKGVPFEKHMANKQD
jgi:hypothetical protein